MDLTPDYSNIPIDRHKYAHLKMVAADLIALAAKYACVLKSRRIDSYDRIPLEHVSGHWVSPSIQNILWDYAQGRGFDFYVEPSSLHSIFYLERIS